MGFWAYQRLVWWRAMKDAWRTAIPHTVKSTARIGAVIVLATLAMFAADRWFHIVDLGLMSADNPKDNLITLGIFVPIALLWLFAMWFFIEGLFLVPYKMWKEAKNAPRKADVTMMTFAPHDQNIGGGPVTALQELESGKGIHPFRITDAHS